MPASAETKPEVTAPVQTRALPSAHSLSFPSCLLPAPRVLLLPLWLSPGRQPRSLTTTVTGVRLQGSVLKLLMAQWVEMWVLTEPGEQVDSHIDSVRRSKVTLYLSHNMSTLPFVRMSERMRLTANIRTKVTLVCFRTMKPPFLWQTPEPVHCHAYGACVLNTQCFLPSFY